MPTYVYKREDGSTFEVMQRITEEPLAVCPTTGQRVTRVIGGAGLIFKGDGFYLTDYARKSGAGASAKSDGESSDSKSNGSDTKAESSSNAKADKTDKTDKTDKGKT